MRKNNELVPMDEFGMFADKDGTARVDSRYVAEVFEKAHKNVLRDIDRIIETKAEVNVDCSRLDFEPRSYTDSRGKRQRSFAMTRTAFTFLAMGFTGIRAFQFKLAYINRFEAMESFIESLQSARMECPELTDNIMQLHETPKSYHFSNEFDMINRIAIGMSAKEFRKLHNIPDGQSIRPHLTDKQIYDVCRLQRMDAGLILGVRDFQERKRILSEYKVNTLDKIKRLNH